MVSLLTVATRFEVNLTVIEGGSGVVRGQLVEPPQTQTPSYIFIAPRRILRVRFPNALRTGMVIRTPEGSVFIVGDNGPSETNDLSLWQSFRLFSATGQYRWQRRTTAKDTVTGLPKDTGLADKGLVWAAIEQIDREAMDLKIRQSIEQARFIAGAPVLADDFLDGRPVVRSDIQSGLRVGVIS